MNDVLLPGSGKLVRIELVVMRVSNGTWRGLRVSDGKWRGRRVSIGTWRGRRASDGTWHGRRVSIAIWYREVCKENMLLLLRLFVF